MPARTRGRVAVAPYLFLLPSVGLVALLLWWPFVRTAFLSFTDHDGFGQPAFVGVGNYVTLARDPVLGQSLLNTFLWVTGTLFLPVGVGLVVAVLTVDLHRGGAYRLPLLLPYALSGTALGVVWAFMLRGDGVVNTLLEAVGLERLTSSWLLAPPLNTLAMIVANSWQAAGVSLLLFVVGLQVIPRDAVEAARVDGAEGWRLFRYITWPLLRPMTVVVVGLSLVNSLKSFDIIWVMTQGGPFRASETLAVTMFRETFLLNRHGYGAAVAVVLSALVLVTSWLYLRRHLRVG